MSRTNYTEAEEMFLRSNVHKCETLYDLQSLFNANFPNHRLSNSNLRHKLSSMGIKKGTHNIRKEKIKSVNSIGTVIIDKNGKKARVKTESGYVSANSYFKKLYLGNSGKDKMIIHLNGDYSDFSRENIEFVNRSVFFSVMWRKWVFENPELTKTAILTAQLLEYFPELRHNENQYYK